MKRLDDELKVDPNPTDGVLNLVIDNNLALENCEWRVMNILGEEVIKDKVISQKQIIDFRKLNQNVYILQLVKQGQIIHSQLIIKE